MNIITHKALTFMFFLLLVTSVSFAQENGEIESCAYCHGTGKHDAKVVTAEQIDKSVHEGTDCDECHEDVEAALHDEKPNPVDCGSCHYETADIYSQHGILKTDPDTHAPSCADCHGTHQILSPEEPESMANVKNLTTTCASCHENPELLKDHPFLSNHPSTNYQNSIHGKTLKNEGDEPVSCIHCHGVDNSAHQILSTGNVKSSINHFALAETCGSCHEGVKESYLEGIHGQLMLRGKTDSPTCTNCHGEHQILSADNAQSRVNAARVAEGTCLPCHSSATLTQEYESTGSGPVSFVDRYHGLKGKSGGQAVATCSSCHEAHKILPASNPDSSVHPQNLQKTCESCHEGISRELANIPIHDLNGQSKKGWPLFFTNLYYVVISVTIGLMLLYIILDFYRHVRSLSKKEQITRMTKFGLLQHTFLLISFSILVATGFALRFSESWWADLFFGKTNLFSERSLIHRSAAVVLISTAFMHLIYLLSKHGREFLSLMIPRLVDLKQLWQIIIYNLGKSDTRPNFGRFSFVEKFEYWALIWGTAIMGITGLILWYDDFFIRFLSLTAIETIRIIHYYEAWLATLAILIWHLYATVFNPGVYPMNTSWISGKMPKEQYQHEHPGDD